MTAFFSRNKQIETARVLNASGNGDSYIWTTQVPDWQLPGLSLYVVQLPECAAMFFVPSDDTEQVEALQTRNQWVGCPQSYLVSLFLDCPPGMGLHCPSAEARAAVEAGIRAGAITWHAFPHNAQVACTDCFYTHDHFLISNVVI